MTLFEKIIVWGTVAIVLSVATFGLYLKWSIGGVVFAGLIMLIYGFAFKSGRAIFSTAPNPQLKLAMADLAKISGQTTKEGRAQTRLMARIGMVVLLWIFLALPGLFCVDYLLIRHGVTKLLAINVLVICGCGYWGYWVGSRLSDMQDVTYRMYDKWTGS